MSINLSQGLPANVVEIGNEVTQAKIDEINAGTLALQTWVTLGFAPKAAPTFTGIVTIPAGASISGYLTTASASSTYQTLSGMTSYLTTSTASSTYQPIGSYLTDAPSNGSEYVRKNAAWAVATGGGGSVAWGSITGTLTSQTDLNTAIGLKADLASPTFSGQVYIPDIRNILNTDLVIDSYNDTGAGTHYLHKFTPNDGKFVLAPNGGGLTFPDSTVQTTAFVVKTVQSCPINPTALGAGEVNKILHFVPVMGGSTITIPADSTYAFPNGTEIVIVSDYSAGGTSNISGQYAGQPTINGLWSVTMTANVSKLVKIGTDIWFYT